MVGQARKFFLAPLLITSKWLWRGVEEHPKASPRLGSKTCDLKKKKVSRSWSRPGGRQFDFSCTRNYILVEKLKVLKSKLKEWNGTMFGKVDENKKAAFKTITHWDSL